MRKIVRLTERDLTRLVKRVINEGNVSTTLIKPLKHPDGKTYQVQMIGDTVAFVVANDPNNPVVDRKIITGLNSIAGFDYGAIPDSTGYVNINYVKKNCFKYGDLCSKLR